MHICVTNTSLQKIGRALECKQSISNLSKTLSIHSRLERLDGWQVSTQRLFMVLTTRKMKVQALWDRTAHSSELLKEKVVPIPSGDTDVEKLIIHNLLTRMKRCRTDHTAPSMTQQFPHGQWCQRNKTWVHIKPQMLMQLRDGLPP